MHTGEGPRAGTDPFLLSPTVTHSQDLNCAKERRQWQELGGPGGSKTSVVRKRGREGNRKT